jgi:hypothetical protein
MMEKFAIGIVIALLLYTAHNALGNELEKLKADQKTLTEMMQETKRMKGAFFGVFEDDAAAEPTPTRVPAPR